MEKSQFDALVIGFGRGGSALADFLGKKGMKVAVVEKSKEMYGGILHQYRLYAHEVAGIIR